MAPVAAADLAEISALKADPLAFAQMLGGVRPPRVSAEELAEDIRCWGANGYGMWTVRARDGGGFLGLTGLMLRTDGLGVALRFAYRQQARGTGLASEAAGAALAYAHETALLPRVVAVTRADNFASRMVLGGIGMSHCDSFDRHGILRLVYRSVRDVASARPGKNAI